HAAATTANRFLCIAELRTTQADVLAALEAATSSSSSSSSSTTAAGGQQQQRWTVEDCDAGDEWRRGRALWEDKGERKREAAGLLILGDLYGEGVGTAGGEEVRAGNEALGVEMREVGDVVREVLGGGGC
ncbi:MAG: hypothetical protein ALECFALPRED_011020, partial [Alectoria fallacina]